MSSCLVYQWYRGSQEKQVWNTQAYSSLTHCISTHVYSQVQLCCCKVWLCVLREGRQWVIEGGKRPGLYFVNHFFWITVDITTGKSNPAIKFFIPCFWALVTDKVNACLCHSEEETIFWARCWCPAIWHSGFLVLSWPACTSAIHPASVLSLLSVRRINQNYLLIHSPAHPQSSSTLPDCRCLQGEAKWGRAWLACKVSSKLGKVISYLFFWEVCPFSSLFVHLATVFNTSTQQMKCFGTK